MREYLTFGFPPPHLDRTDASIVLCSVRRRFDRLNTSKWVEIVRFKVWKDVK